MRGPDLRRTSARTRAVGILLVASFLLLGLRAAQLSLLDPRGALRGRAQSGTALRLAAARGSILDRNGATLALSVEAPSAYAAPARVADVPATARSLARILGIPRAQLRERLQTRSHFVFLARWIRPTAAAALRRAGLPGIGLVEEPRRAYPHGALAGRLLGFANVDGEGVRGIEQLEEPWLRGHARWLRAERDARGRLLLDGDADPRQSTGGDVALSLDAALQAQIDAALEKSVAATAARSGLVVVLEIETGDLLALAEWPPFDPNRFRRTAYTSTGSAAFLSAGEPGSALKPFLVAAALDGGVVGSDERIDCEEGSFRIPGKVLHDTHPHGSLALADILRVSSNIGAAKIGFRLGAERHYAALRAFGFGAPTGSGFPEESAGLLRSWQHWQPVDHATISFGQGISVTAIQLAAATAALGADGVWKPPRLVRATRPPGGPWRQRPPSQGRRVVRKEVARQVLAMMQGVTRPGGTGWRAALRGVPVAGKTGTAQKLDPKTGHYARDRFRAWFIGVVPADAPQLAVVAMLDEPRGRTHTGGASAAPLFARAAAAALARRGIQTEPVGRLPVVIAEAPRSVSAPAAGRSRRAGPPARVVVRRLGGRVLLPDFRGLTPRQVRRIAASGRLQVTLEGRGHAVAQEPAPGTILVAGAARVHVRFQDPPGGKEG